MDSGSMQPGEQLTLMLDLRGRLRQAGKDGCSLSYRLGSLATENTKLV